MTGTDGVEHAVLTAFFDATGGSNWRRSDNWLSDRPLGDWYGIDADGDGRVTRLILKGNNLSGYLPPELGDLSHLRELRLHSNRLTGSIPSTLGNLTNLTALVLSLNRLDGAIPGELGGVRKITELALNNNKLTGGIPSELGRLWRLDGLNLGNNELSRAVPEALGNLSGLTVLAIGGNEGLSDDLPLSLRRLSSLRVFHYHETGVSVPESLGSWLSGIVDRRGPSPRDWTYQR